MLETLTFDTCQWDKRESQLPAALRGMTQLRAFKFDTGSLIAGLPVVAINPALHKLRLTSFESVEFDYECRYR